LIQIIVVSGRDKILKTFINDNCCLNLGSKNRVQDEKCGAILK